MKPAIDLPEFRGNRTDFYDADPAVAEIVNLAILLERPLLVEGEPGCGKTKLADAIAFELGLGEPVRYTVRSSSQARDLLYRFDALRRFQDAQDPNNQKAQNIYPYLTLGRLGEAILGAERKVVLIDEIDKADIDFPNDLLDVLDTFRFEVEDLPAEEEDHCSFPKTVESSPDSRPIVVITSNREKQLPEPFLRRCLLVELTFPDEPERLRRIVRLNLDGVKAAGGGAEREGENGDPVLEAAVERFRRIRAAAIDGHALKPPTTSELIDWVRVLHWRGVVPEAIDVDFPPYWITLFKTAADRDAYRRTAAGAVGDEGAE